VGTATHDDAGVFRLSPELALIQTVDYFTPIVDDPHQFGSIAAANALSDVYAMGGVPRTALNIVGWPQDELEWDVLATILRGGQEVVEESGATIAGGHSVKSPELFYGLSITGTIHPDRVVTNAGGRPGDLLFLTKPLGTGILTTALKRGLLESELLQTVTETMRRLNAAASETMQEIGVHAATDVTGFGFAGHLREMLEASACSAEIELDRVPFLPGVYEHAKAGHKAGGLHSNRQHVAEMLEFDKDLDPELVDLLCDPQTSGGLLIAVEEAKAEALARALAARGIVEAGPIGRLLPRANGRIQIRLRAGS
jgi:selenide,water dikinase